MHRAGTTSKNILSFYTMLSLWNINKVKKDKKHSVLQEFTTKAHSGRNHVLILENGVFMF